MTTIYTQALNAIKANKVNATLYTGRHKHVLLTRSNGHLNLVYQKRDDDNLVRKTVQVKCAIYMPNRGGWVFSLDRDTYARWVAKTGHEVAQ